MTKFKGHFPDGFFLDRNSILEVEIYLKKQGWIPSSDTLLSLDKPGEGNMNYVLRVVCENSGSFIIKQSRPWVEKYPQFDAPVDRNIVEKQFLELVESDLKISKFCPKVFGFDDKSNILFTEDIVEAKDFTYIYKNENSIERNEIAQFVHFINKLNELKVVKSFPENLEMRSLNYQHIFELPFNEDNGFPLDEIQNGLLDISMPFKTDKGLKKRVREIGEVYLAKGQFLQHGDLYPGSLLKNQRGLYVIDPEFAFLGPLEWDIAIFTAHLILARTETELISSAMDSLKKPKNFNQMLFSGIVGTEIIRRLIGIAQLPLSLTIEEKEQLLNNAAGLIKNGM